MCRVRRAAYALPRRDGLGIFSPLLSAVANRLPRRASDFSRDRFRRTAQMSGLVSHRKRPGAWNRNRTGRYRSRSRHYLGCGLFGSRLLFDGRILLDCFFLRRLSSRLFFARFPAGSFFNSVFTSGLSRDLPHDLLFLDSPFAGLFICFLLCSLLFRFCHANLLQYPSVVAPLRWRAPFPANFRHLVQRGASLGRQIAVQHVRINPDTTAPGQHV